MHKQHEKGEEMLCHTLCHGVRVFPITVPLMYACSRLEADEKEAISEPLMNPAPDFIIFTHLLRLLVTEAKDTFQEGRSLILGWWWWKRTQECSFIFRQSLHVLVGTLQCETHGRLPKERENANHEPSSCFMLQSLSTRKEVGFFADWPTKANQY